MLVLKLSSLISWLCGPGLTSDDEGAAVKAEYQQYYHHESLFKQKIYDILDIIVIACLCERV